MAATSSKGAANKGKRKKTSSSQDESMPSLHVSRFTSTTVFRDFNRACTNREVLIERMFDEPFLRYIKFPWLDRLKSWGWWDFISYEGDVNPNLVKLFYFHGDAKTYGDDNEVVYGLDNVDSFKTLVLGKEFPFNAPRLKDFVSSQIRLKGDDCIPNDYPFAEKCKLIYNDPTICCIEKRTSKMDLHTRILHLLVCQVIYPRGGDFANASTRDLFVMAKIIEDDPPNLCALIIRRMLEGVRHSKTSKNSHGLPYGKLVSKICRSLCSVSPNELVDTSKGMEPLDAQSVKKMGWTQDPRTGEWKKKEKGKASQEEEESSTSVFERLEGLVLGMGERLSRIEEKVDHVNANVEALRRNQPFDVPYPVYPHPHPSPPSQP